MEIIVQWNNERHWMENNQVDVETEFPEEIQKNENMITKMGLNKRLKYFKVYNDIIKWKYKS